MEMIFFPKCFQLEIREGDGKLHQTGGAHFCLVVLIKRLKIPLLMMIEVVSNVISITTSAYLEQSYSPPTSTTMLHFSRMSCLRVRTITNCKGKSRNRYRGSHIRGVYEAEERTKSRQSGTIHCEFQLPFFPRESYPERPLQTIPGSQHSECRKGTNLRFNHGSKHVPFIDSTRWFMVSLSDVEKKICSQCEGQSNFLFLSLNGWTSWV